MIDERDHALGRTAEWLKRAHLCITDASGKRRRTVDFLAGRLISELPEAYHVARKEIDEEFREMTKTPESLDRSVIKSSVMPSAK